jgi:acetyl-CoA carboxylase biotin carboxyl carrier protein
MRVSVRRADEPAAPGNHVAAVATAEVVEVSVEDGSQRDGVIRIESPMVGVFYRASSPGAPAFVNVGDTVLPDQTLCLIEAMKLFNELKSDVAGTVRAIHVENGAPVEFGQLLFEIDPVLTPPAV